MLKNYFITLFVVLFSSYGMADWNLVNSQSSLNFVSVKKSKVGEVHRFSQLSGTIKDSGQSNVKIDLSSVETNIAIRNERMISMLFDTVTFPDAMISGKIPLSQVAQLEAGDTFVSTLKLSLSLHGNTRELSSRANITKLTDNRILVTSVAPIIIKAEDYTLAEGVEALRAVAKLTSISTAVPVTFSLLFSKQ
ncbi:MAG: YceI family protein [Pseudomonadales bacterium]|nr:YceI family protein [Pseudomonadales bacterium]